MRIAQLILDSGGGPTLDKPEVLLETPSDLNRVSSFLKFACRRHLGLLQTMERQRSALSHRAIGTVTAGERRCYMRDPDGYLIEVGQYTENRPRLVKEPQLIWQAINGRTFEASPSA